MPKGEKKDSRIDSNIELVLTKYDDIFSYFDSRDYPNKAISVDFIDECRRAAKDKSDKGVGLILAIPRPKRNAPDEIKIKKRLKNHFQKHHLEKNQEIKKIKMSGLRWIILGAILMIGAALIQTYLTHTLTLNMILAIAGPAGWFWLWEGLGKVYIDAREKEPERDFYKKMSNASITFISK